MTTSQYAHNDLTLGAGQTALASALAPLTEAVAQPLDGASSKVAAAPAISTQAIFSMVFGILSLWPLPLIGSIIAIVTGYLARREIASAGGQLGGSRQALFGMAMGAAMLALWMLAACAVLAIRLSSR